MKERIIGVFDSGLGGISILKAIHRKLPCENIVYVGDCLHAPYGDRTQEYITDRVRRICRYFLSLNAKAIVIACNTATAAAIDAMRQEISIPIIGVEPALKPAVRMTRTGSIGVMATTGTIKSRRYLNLIRKYNPDGCVNVVSAACPGLMDCVEKGAWETEDTKALIRKFIAPMKDSKADVVVLGCTHYPFLKKAIREELGDSAQLYDPSAPVAEEAKNQLMKRGTLTSRTTEGRIVFRITGLTPGKAEIIDMLWEGKANAEDIDL